MRPIPLVMKFGLLSLALVVLMGLATGAVLVRQVQSRALLAAERLAASVAETAVLPGLRPEDLEAGKLPADRAADLQRRMASALGDGSVLHVNVFDRRGTVVWADDAGLIGTSTHQAAGLNAALAGRPSSVAEDEEEIPVLETYVPLRFDSAGPVLGAFEVYSRYAPVQADIRRDTSALLLVLSVSLLLLWLLLSRMVATADKALRASARNEWLARRDVLTGLWNRRALNEKLRAAAEEARPLSLLVADVNSFKPINDRYGHTWGDIVLQLVGEKLTEAARDVDFVARVGGDEFAVVLHEKAPEAAAQRISAAFDDVRIVVDGDPVSVQAAFGLAIADSRESDPEVVLQRADLAMYSAKRHGVRLEVWTPGMSSSVTLPAQTGPSDVDAASRTS
jgi:diguanylate cyclase (GGDEF)-like protein